jgi:hypothetical protein
VRRYPGVLPACRKDYIPIVNRGFEHDREEARWGCLMWETYLRFPQPVIDVRSGAPSAGIDMATRPN